MQKPAGVEVGGSPYSRGSLGREPRLDSMSWRLIDNLLGLHLSKTVQPPADHGETDARPDRVARQLEARRHSRRSEPQGIENLDDRGALTARASSPA